MIGTTQKPENRLINAIISIFTTTTRRQQILAQQTITGKKQKIREFTSGSAVGCNADEVCCGVNLGDRIHYECLPEDKCIKSY